MPIQVTVEAAEATGYGNPFVNALEQTDTVFVDISELTTAEVDADGYLKPGVPFKKDGTVIDGTAGEYVYGLPPEPIKIVAKGPTNATLAADTRTFAVGVGLAGLVNRDIIEDNLGRALSANELAAFAATGSHLILTRT